MIFFCYTFSFAGRKIGPREKSQDLLLNEVVISKRDYSGERDSEELELPLFDYCTIAIATNNFSDEYKLGQGGFGCVHKVNSALENNHQNLHYLEHKSCNLA